MNGQDAGQGIDIAVVCGSLRKASFNRMLMRAALSRAPSYARFHEIDIADLPLYNGDIEPASGFPEPVLRMREIIERSDALLIVSPEYNTTIPGTIATFINWASRPEARSPLAHLLCGMISTSPGNSGGMRMQSTLKVALDSCLTVLFPHKPVNIPRAREKFDVERGLHDEDSLSYVETYMHDFCEWVVAMRAAQHRRVGAGA